MRAPDRTVLRETGYIALFTLILSALMQAVFLVIGKWDYTVLLGNLLTGAAAVANFFLMGQTVQAAAGREEKDARQMMRASQGLRMVGLFAVLAVGVILPCFNTVAVILPVFFPRIAVMLRQLLLKKEDKNEK